MNIENLQRILKINSEEKPAEADAPFGAGVKACLDETLKIGEEMGFTVKNVDNYGGHIDWEGSDPESAKLCAIIGHLDVVPAGTDWDYDPYGAEVVDGILYGRGTTDDKGPIMVCLEAMKALKDEGVVPKNTIRLILGCDEETNWKGMNYYFEHEKRPDYGFTPDADFPIINGEKGILHFQIAKKFDKTQVKGLELRSIKGGTAANAVPDYARAVLRSPDGYDKVKATVEAYRDKTGHHINYKAVGKSFEITAQGKAAHGAKPEDGLNAISIIMELLGGMSFVNEDQNDFISFYNQHLGFETDGSSIGCRMHDDVSGSLSLNVGIIELDSEAMRLTIDVRYPVSNTADEVYDAIIPIIEKYNMGIIRGIDKKPIFIDLDNPLVQDLLSVYREKTGDAEAQALVIGGGTYARSTPGIVAFGAQLPGDVDVMHQRNERIGLEKLDLLFEIYKEAIYKLASAEYNIQVAK